MANTLRIKRRASGGGAGAPSSLENAELAFNEQTDVLYYGKGTGGTGGSATQIIPIAGAGAFVDLSSVQSIESIKTFTVSPNVPTVDQGDNSNKAASTAYVDAAVTAGSIPDGNKGDITVSAGGATWTINAGAWAGAPISDAAQDALDLKLDASEKGAANGVAPLGADSKVPALYLPSYVDDVLEFPDLASFPTTGENGIIYVALDTGFIYRWSGSAYIRIAGSPGSTDDVPEGSVNLYYTDARARAAVIVQSITSGDTTHSPSSAAVFSAIANFVEIADLGTMALQNANAVAITGGTIDNIVIDGGTF